MPSNSTTCTNIFFDIILKYEILLNFPTSFTQCKNHIFPSSFIKYHQIYNIYINQRYLGSGTSMGGSPICVKIYKKYSFNYFALKYVQYGKQTSFGIFVGQDMHYK